ncbi:hypothetical protein BRADI_4g26100v3 [Brachypodium distachyon]|uniref:RRM domain-containing protein n=1 Tax=Brachypodium distachyon TaxID=15368 RepID=I1INN7_BRADI|nr:hypothetical protein BRADI_4g26100v3 [Brachypodium distachyon]
MTNEKKHFSDPVHAKSRCNSSGAMCRVSYRYVFCKSRGCTPLSWRRRNDVGRKLCFLSKLLVLSVTHLVHRLLLLRHHHHCQLTPLSARSTASCNCASISAYVLVQDMWIPYQAKRMFGFVSFMHLESVWIVLAKVNPHIICGTRDHFNLNKEKPPKDHKARTRCIHSSVTIKLEYKERYNAWGEGIGGVRWVPEECAGVALGEAGGSREGEVPPTGREPLGSG